MWQQTAKNLSQFNQTFLLTIKKKPDSTYVPILLFFLICRTGTSSTVRYYLPNI